MKIIFQIYHTLPWRDSISRPVVPVSSVAGENDITRPRRQGIAILCLRDELVGHAIPTFVENFLPGYINSYPDAKRLKNWQVG
jgi:hypothetical protein